MLTANWIMEIQYVIARKDLREIRLKIAVRISNVIAVLFLLILVPLLVPEGDECTPNPCGSNSGCRLVGNKAVCFCLPEFEGTPPQVPCTLPSNPCNPSPCGPNTQCSILINGFAKCTCLPGYLESPNTIRGMNTQSSSKITIFIFVSMLPLFTFENTYFLWVYLVYRLEYQS